MTRAHAAARCDSAKRISAAQLTPQQAALIENCIGAVCRRQTAYLRQNHIEVEDAIGDLSLIALRALPKWDAERGALSTWVTGLAKKRLLTVVRDRTRPCRRLPPRLRAPEHEAANVPDEPQDDADPALLSIGIEQSIRYLMTAGRGMQPVKQGHTQTYSPESRQIVVYLAARLNMGARGMRDYLAADPKLLAALKWRRCPALSVLSKWFSTGGTKILHDSVRGLAGACRRITV